jgi:hypothetical protein
MSSQDYTQSATKFPPKTVFSQRMGTLQYSIPTLARATTVLRLVVFQKPVLERRLVITIYSFAY